LPVFYAGYCFFPSNRGHYVPWNYRVYPNTTKGFAVRWGTSKLALTCTLVLAFGLLQPAVSRESGGGSVGVIPLPALPVQGQETYQLIHRGGPFPYEKDGSVFGNRERLLPGQKRGYYREYTVKTPGERDRGARRIVCGGAATTPDVCYYTADHYDSFRRIVP
jgi:ribonuclease T1